MPEVVINYVIKQAITTSTIIVFAVVDPRDHHHCHTKNSNYAAGKLFNTLSIQRLH